MGTHRNIARRPKILNGIALVSTCLSILNALWVGIIALVVLLIGGAGWFVNPILGAAGTVVAAAVGFVVLAQSFLSVLLFLAAWKTWGGDPGGRSLHRAWAWITLVLDALDLLLTGGLDGGAWVRLVYAVIVLSVMGRADVLAYYGRRRDPAATDKKAAPVDEWA